MFCVANNAVIAAGKTDDCNQISVIIAPHAYCLHLISAVSFTAEMAGYPAAGRIIIMKLSQAVGLAQHILPLSTII